MSLTKQQLEDLNNSSFPNNNAGAITADLLRNYNSSSIAAFVDENTYLVESASFSARINSGGGNVNTSSLVTTASFNAFTSSYYTDSASFNSRINAITSSGNINTSSLATTGSNTFTGNQTINNANINSTYSGQLSFVSGSPFTISNTNGYGLQLNLSSSTGRTLQIQNTGGPITISGSSTSIQGVNWNTYSASVDSRINAITGSGGSLVGVITTGSFTTASQTVKGDFEFNAYASGGISADFVSQNGGGNIVYVSYGDAFNANQASTDFIYWLDTNFANVKVSGPGITNGTITQYFYTDNIEVYVQSGTITNGGTYTFTGPGLQTIAVTGSLGVNKNIRTTNTLIGADSIGIFDNSFTYANQWIGIGGGGGQYGGIGVKVKSEAHPGDIYADLSITDSSISENGIGFSYNTYAPVFGGQYLSTIYGGGNGNNIPDNNGNVIMAAISGSTYWYKNLELTGSLSINSNYDLYAHGHKQFNYGAFQTNISQSGSANVSQSVTFEVTDSVAGVSMVSGSRITFANAGVYSTTFSAQCDNTDNAAQTIYIWLKKNGTNVAESATKLVIPKNQAQVMTVNFINEINANDYLELAWQSTNSGCYLVANNASGNIPAIPSVILTTTQVR